VGNRRNRSRAPPRAGAPDRLAELLIAEHYSNDFCLIQEKMSRFENDPPREPQATLPVAPLKDIAFGSNQRRHCEPSGQNPISLTGFDVKQTALSGPQVGGELT
jgi:hypothetical protein